MPNSKLMLSLLFLVFSAALTIPAMVLVPKRDMLTNKKTKDDCEASSPGAADGSVCGRWNDDNLCMKGKYNASSGKCEIKVDWLPLLLLSSGSICFLIFLGFLLSALIGGEKKGKKKGKR